MANEQPALHSPKRRYFKEVRFRQIRALVELSRQGSFASAATSLGLAVPSVWQQVRALEDEYGVQLVVASGAQLSMRKVMNLCRNSMFGHSAVIHSNSSARMTILLRLHGALLSLISSGIRSC